MNTSMNIEPELIINPNTREIYVPKELYNIGVVYDDNSEIIKIRIPRYFDGFDFSIKDCTIVYNNALKERGEFHVEEKEVFEDSILLDWCISRHVTKKSGKIHFSVVFKSSNAEHNKTYSWATSPAELNVMVWLDENVDYGDNDSGTIEDLKQKSHTHHNMSVLNKITQKMLDLISHIEPLKALIESHTLNLEGKYGNSFHLPLGGTDGQVLGKVRDEDDILRNQWIDQTGGGTVEIPTKVSAFENDARYQTYSEMETFVGDKLSTKVDKENGKGLSSNDFTDELKSKLEDIDNHKVIFSTTVPSELQPNTICFVYEE